MNRQLRALGRSFACAGRGIWQCVSTQRNMRIHLAIAAYVFYFCRYYALTSTQYALLFITVALVLAAELVNTAVEATVDLCSPDVHPLARRAKDTAAGAVLVCAVFAVAVGVALFGDLAVIWRIVWAICSDWLHVLLFLGSVILAVAWAFIGPQPAIERMKRRREDRK